MNCIFGTTLRVIEYLSNMQLEDVLFDKIPKISFKNKMNTHRTYILIKPNTYVIILFDQVKGEVIFKHETISIHNDILVLCDLFKGHLGIKYNDLYYHKSSGNLYLKLNHTNINSNKPGFSENVVYQNFDNEIYSRDLTEFNNKFDEV